MEFTGNNHVILSRRCGMFSINHCDCREINITSQLFEYILPLNHFPVVLCLGSDKITGDSLAPLVGSMLKSLHSPCFVYGDLKYPVTAKNLLSTLKYIKNIHSFQKILIIDASVGKQCDIGKIKFSDHGISPGKATGQNFETMGDLSIVGIVTTKNEIGKINPTRLFHIFQLAETITKSIYTASRDFKASFQL